LSLLSYPTEFLRKIMNSKGGSILSGLPFLKSIERDGEQFFQAGKSIVKLLQQASKTLLQRNIDGLRKVYAPHFMGTSLGLTTMVSRQERDGIQTDGCCASNSLMGADAAITEWLSYLAGFEETEEIGIHLHRLHKWQSPERFDAIVRLEHIGRLRGAVRSCIDRAYARMSFAVSNDTLQICTQSLVDGERIISDEPSFINVARTAGIDFKNEYYPPFLSDPLKFGMIRTDQVESQPLTMTMTVSMTFSFRMVLSQSCSETAAMEPLKM
jgi:hypothetical protein